MVVQRRWVVGLGVIAAVLSGCGFVASHPSAVATRTHFYPVKNRSGTLKSVSLSRLVPNSAWHHLGGLPFGEDISSVNSGELLLSVYPPGPGQLSSKKWPDGLYLINAKTGKTTRVVRLPNILKPSVAFASGSWVAYEAADSLSGNYQTVNVKNIATGQVTAMMTLPKNVYSTGDIQGLTIHQHVVYWLTNALSSAGMSSTVYAYNLNTKKLTVVLREDPKTNNRMFFAMQATAHGLWLSVNNSGDLKLTTTPGTLWYWSFATRRVTHRIPVYHAPTLLYGGVPGGAVFSGDYSLAPGSPVNPAPYPVYVANYEREVVIQITPADNPGGETSVDGPYVAIDGVGENGELVNTQQNSVTTIPSPRGLVSGGYVVIEQSQSLRWAPLPH